ncbi:hypothetical protein BKA64DRAFT_700871 [Cadophora sp. MPI-SDFR-AT-0126]|nr:hypothetical protein BKA64DRAFT_700871 [Leotiomycetes sp. MPI-SDFR-AT-0126]
MPTLRQSPTKSAKALPHPDTGEGSDSHSQRCPAQAQKPSQSYPERATEIDKDVTKSLQHYANGFNHQLPDPVEFPHLAYLFEEPKSEPFRTAYDHNINGLPTKKDREYEFPGKDEVPESIKRLNPVVPRREEGEDWYRHLNGPTPEQAAARAELERNLLKRKEEATRYNPRFSYARNEATENSSPYKPLPRDHWSTLSLACNILFSTVKRKEEEKKQNIAPCDCRNGMLQFCRCAKCPREAKHYTTHCHCVLKDSEVHQEKIPQPKEKLAPLKANPTARQAKEHKEKQDRAIAKAVREDIQLRREEAELNRMLPPTCGHLNEFQETTAFRGDQFPARCFYAFVVKRDSSGHRTFDHSELDIDSFTTPPQPISPAEGSLSTTEKGQATKQAQFQKPRTPLPSGRPYSVTDYLRRQSAKETLEDAESKATPMPLRRKTVAQEKSSNVSKEQMTSSAEAEGTIPLAKGLASVKRKAADQMPAKVAKKQKTTAAPLPPTAQQTLPTAGRDNTTTTLPLVRHADPPGGQEEEEEEAGKELWVDPNLVWVGNNTPLKLRLLGLTPNSGGKKNYGENDETAAPGMCDKPEFRLTKSKEGLWLPCWGWVTWILLARCPERKYALSLRTIHELAKTWIPGFEKTPRQSLRAALCRGDAFIPEGNTIWRLRRDGEPIPPKGAGPGTGTGKSESRKRGGRQAEEMPRFDENDEEVEDNEDVEDDEEVEYDGADEDKEGEEVEETSAMMQQ